MSELQALVSGLEQDGSLDEPVRVHERIDALDRLERYLLDDQCGDLCDRARTLYERLETVESRLHQAIRGEIKRGRRPDWLLHATPAIGEGYDYLDVLISGVLRLEQPAAGLAEPAAEMIAYQPTPARHILDLLRRAALTEQDVLVDIGSGLGHVPLLTAICTDARSIGVELEPAYVKSAWRSARELDLANATFVQQDARTADYAGGTAFYLYTPFTGSIMRAVLDSLRREASSHPLRVFTYGPCTATVAEEPWLVAAGRPRPQRISMFRSRS